MRSREILPSPSLRPYVRLIWMLEVDDPAVFGPPERINPDGLVELVFHYRTPLACRYDGEPFSRQPRSVAVSQTRRFVEIHPQDASGLISVRFHPWGAYHFFCPPVSELSDRQVPIELLWGRAGRELEERLWEASSAARRVALVEGFLLEQLARYQKTDIEPLIRAIWRHRGRVPIAQLCSELGIAERRLQRTFAAALGTTPKGYARLTRFLHACSLLLGDRPHGLADIGQVCGYYDQSHFIAEFKSFSGLTPRRFARAGGASFLELD